MAKKTHAQIDQERRVMDKLSRYPGGLKFDEVADQVGMANTPLEARLADLKADGRAVPRNGRWYSKRHHDAMFLDKAPRGCPVELLSYKLELLGKLIDDFRDRHRLPEVAEDLEAIRDDLERLGRDGLAVAG